MLAVARSYALVGVEAVPVEAEIDIRPGLPAFSVVGLPDAAVRESRERVRAAIVNSGFDFPLRRITASLAPAEMRKAGPGFDLPIAAAILAASDQTPEWLLGRWALAGELALDGRLRPVRGALAMAECAARDRGRGLVLPRENAAEAALIEGLPVAALRGLRSLPGLAAGELPDAPPGPPPTAETAGPDMSDLRGQPGLRRALEIAAAGGHNLRIVGPPGAGKSMAARRLPSIMPALGSRERIEVLRIAGAAGLESGPTVCRRPFRAPHHTISPAGLVGGGAPPRPGEITLAHRGVLFLDEVAEFPRSALEALRGPLEDGAVSISRASGTIRLPARFQLIAAANPCPCGRGGASEECRCSAEQIHRYEMRLSGALSDRIDIALALAQPSPAALAGDPGEPSAAIRSRVEHARGRQRRRLGDGRANAQLSGEELRVVARAEPRALSALERDAGRLRLSGRGFVRVLRLARTIADLEGSEVVAAGHIDEAVSLRGRGA